MAKSFFVVSLFFAVLLRVADGKELLCRQLADGKELADGKLADSSSDCAKATLNTSSVDKSIRSLNTRGLLADGDLLRLYCKPEFVQPGGL